VPTGGSAHHRRRGDGATLVMSEATQGSSGALQVTIVVDGEALGSRLPVNWHALIQVMHQERRAL
jgi:hypothetical protein